jgi:HEPN domain-containing protein
MRREDEKVQLTKGWLAKADEDLRAVERLMHPPEMFGSAAFHCQQAFEKALKAYLVWNDTPFRKTHNLEELVRQCEAFDLRFHELLTLARQLSPFITEFRYPDIESEVDTLAMKSAWTATEDAVAMVRSMLPPEVAPQD